MRQDLVQRLLTENRDKEKARKRDGIQVQKEGKEGKKKVNENRKAVRKKDGGKGK